MFGLQSMCYAAVINWVAEIYVRAGWSAGAAALAPAAVSLLNVPAALVIPALSDGRERGTWLLGAALAMGTGLLGLAFAPTLAPWLWLIVFSLGSGALFPLVLTLPLDLGETEGAVTELTSWMLGFGYILSATGPLVVGGLYDLTGAFVLPMASLAVLGCSPASSRWHPDCAGARPLRRRRRPTCRSPGSSPPPWSPVNSRRCSAGEQPPVLHAEGIWKLQVQLPSQIDRYLLRELGLDHAPVLPEHVQ